MRYAVAAATLLSAAASVSANTFTVAVGANNTLAFDPSSLTGVANGDTINFQFVSKNHSVVQSTFPAPCTGNGVSSGFQAVNDTSGASGFPTWSITVDNATAPLWFFCSQTTPNSTHCQAGMVFSVNAATTGNKTFDAFQQAAKNSNATAPAPGQNPTPVTIISGAAGATESAISVGGSSTAPSATPASGSGSGSGSNSSSGSAPAATTTGSGKNGAARLSGNSISLLAVVGLVAGLAL